MAHPDDVEFLIAGTLFHLKAADWDVGIVTMTAGDKGSTTHSQGEVARINDYCRCDVLDTYYAFLRAAVLIGWLTLDKEQELVEKTHNWLQKQASETPALQQYLDNWGNWHNPWADQPEGT